MFFSQKCPIAPWLFLLLYALTGLITIWKTRQIVQAIAHELGLSPTLIYTLNKTSTQSQPRGTTSL